MSESVLKAQVKAAAYGLVALTSADRAVDFLRQLIAEITRDNPGSDWSGPGSR